MSERKFYWLKLPENFFKDKAMKRLASIAGGDTYTKIYLKMLLASLETEGALYYDGIEEDIYSEIALVIDEKTENVRATLAYLSKIGYVEDSVDCITLTRLPAMVGSESSSTRRSRKCREKKKLALQCNTDATDCSTEIEIEKEIEKRDREDTLQNAVPEPEEKKAKTPGYQKIIDMYHSICTSYPRVVKLTEGRKKAISARLNSGYTVEDLEKAFQMAENSPFMKGKNDRNWKADFDWIMKDSNLAKILEGKYNEGSGKDETGRNKAQTNGSRSSVTAW